MHKTPDTALQPSLLSYLPGILYRCQNNPNRTMLELSGNVQQLTGYSPDGFLENRDQTFASIIHFDDRERVWNAMQAGLERGGIFDLVYRILTVDGCVKDVWEHGEGIYRDGKLVEVAGFISDKSPNFQQSKKLRTFQKKIVKLSRSGDLVRGDVEKFSRDVTAEAADILQVDRSSVWLLDEDQSEMELVCLYEKQGALFTTGANLHADDYPAYFRALVTGRAIDAEDAYSDPRTSEFSAQYLPATGVMSMMDACIRVSGKVVGVLCNEQVGRRRHWESEDISYAGELADQLAQAIANGTLLKSRQEIVEASAASRAKSQLLATMSHEIRTPMNGVLGMVELLATTQLNEQQQSYLDTLRDSGNLLMTIINDVLDYAKAEAGKLTLSETSTSIGEVFSGVRDLLIQTIEPGVQLLLKPGENFPERVWVDSHRIRQILINLLGNAAKFTTHGQIVVSYQQLNPTQWMFQISDTGQGIPEEQVADLFEPFAQVVTSEANIVPRGTGLGLSICKELVGLMGGELGVRSELGKGTTVTVTLPLKLSPSQDVRPMDTTTDAKDNLASDCQSLRVLVAEDNAVNRKVIVGLLKQYEIEPILCGNGREVVDYFESNDSNSVDLILMDCEMPLLDGFQTATQLRQQFSAKNLPVIAALTAHAMEEFRDRAEQAGMDFYLTKPIRQAELQHLLMTVADGAAAKLSPSRSTGQLPSV